ncbi:hypothetical protein D3C81_1217710 [compost metagenome]
MAVQTSGTSRGRPPPPAAAAYGRRSSAARRSCGPGCDTPGSARRARTRTPSARAGRCGQSTAPSSDTRPGRRACMPAARASGRRRASPSPDSGRAAARRCTGSAAGCRAPPAAGRPAPSTGRSRPARCGCADSESVPARPAPTAGSAARTTAPPRRAPAWRPVRRCCGSPRSQSGPRRSGAGPDSGH